MTGCLPWNDEQLSSDSTAAHRFFAKRYRLLRAELARTEEELVCIRVEMLSAMCFFEEKVEVVSVALREAQQHLVTCTAICEAHKQEFVTSRSNCLLGDSTELKAAFVRVRLGGGKCAALQAKLRHYESLLRQSRSCFASLV